MQEIGFGRHIHYGAKMNTDSQILVKGMESLIKSLGIVESEKFISLILRESSDYTQWRKDLFKI